MENKDTKIKYSEWIYVGKEYTRTFDNDGQKVKAYKFLFKENENQQYAKKVWGTEQTKGASELEEGNFFVVGYVEDPIVVEGKQSFIKKGKFFGKPNNNSFKERQTTQKDNTQKIQLNTKKTQGLDEYINSKPQLKEIADKCIALGDCFLDNFANDKTAFNIWVIDRESGITYFADAEHDTTEEIQMLYQYIMKELTI